MTHEFKNIVKAAVEAKECGLKSVLASVVDLDGSSYRRPGVRMLITENGTLTGAVSGGCVEKEIVLQAESIFKTDIAKIMTYDGRYRLGCEGVLYILIEPYEPHVSFESVFKTCLMLRKSFQLKSYYEKEVKMSKAFGTMVHIDDEVYPLNPRLKNQQLDKKSIFSQTMPPCFKLIIIGAEHDAVQLCKYAALTGWEVIIVSNIKENKSIKEFPSAETLWATTPETVDFSLVDQQTAVVLMTHNFAYDLRYLVALSKCHPNYIGVLGPARRREDLLSQLMTYCPELDTEFLDLVHGPAGLNIGSETPQEIAVSIVSEILAITRNKHPMSLSEKQGRIHQEK
ncbi:XdhC family protein [Pseudotamlana carrageenivorans]|uniref:XshC-Cox1-family protein n=1 Tax=Pseudotamlana carrageenivorans TaxID=2069432 RepID=A0A2I7SM69_9FLAO|nr:XdhC/CoxI family protein [Tamlana carrageenivorans]AUS06982.1 XshC-Cox1-family protein [Tamlana carrageenivorans]